MEGKTASPFRAGARGVRQEAAGSSLMPCLRILA